MLVLASASAFVCLTAPHGTEGIQRIARYFGAINLNWFRCTKFLRATSTRLGADCRQPWAIEQISFF